MFLYSFELLLAIWLAISLFLSCSSLPSFISSTLFLSHLLLQQLCLQNVCTNYPFRGITESLVRKHLVTFSEVINNSAWFFFQMLKVLANFTSATPSLSYTMENTALSKSRVNALMLKKKKLQLKVVASLFHQIPSGNVHSMKRFNLSWLTAADSIACNQRLARWEQNI